MPRLYYLINYITYYIKSWNEEKKTYALSLSFLFSLFFVPNNKFLLVVSVIFVLALYLLWDNLIKVLVYSYILFLPFQNGKSFQFLLVPAELVHNHIPFFLSITYSLSNFMAAILLYLFIRDRLFFRVKNKSVKMTFANVLLFYFVFSFIVASLVSEIPLLSFLLGLQILGYIFIYYFIQVYGLTAWIIKKFFAILTSICIFEGAWSCMQFLNKGSLGKSIEGLDPSFPGILAHAAGEDSSYFRMQGTFSHPNFLGFFMATFVPILLYISISKYSTKFGKIMAMIGSLLGVAGLILSGSRASWIVFAVGIFIILKNKKIVATFAILPFIKRCYIGVLIGIIIVLPLLLIPRLMQFTTTFGNAGGVQFRVFLIEKSLEIVVRQPLGIGLGMFPKILFEQMGGFTSSPTQPHNLFIQILVASGMGGLFSYMGFTYIIIRNSLIGVGNQGFEDIIKLLGNLSLGCFLVLSLFYPILTEQTIFGWFFVLLLLIV